MSAKTGSSGLLLVIIALLTMILWLGLDFFRDYKNVNMPEKAKAEMVLQQTQDTLMREQQHAEEQALIASRFNEVPGDRKLVWVVLNILNSIWVKLMIGFIGIVGFGLWYVNRKSRI